MTSIAGGIAPACSVPRIRAAPSPWLALATGAACCAWIGAWGAPDRLDTLRVLVSGGDGAAASLQGAVARSAAGGVQVTRQGATVTIAVRGATTPFAPAVPDIHALLANAISDIAAATPAATPLPVTANPGIGLLAGERMGLQGELGDADRASATISSNLSDTVREIANIQRIDAAPPSDPAADPIRGLLAQMEMRRIELAAKYTEDFPGIAMADGEIARLRQLARQQKAPAPSSHVALATLGAERARLQTALEGAASRRAALALRIARLDDSLKDAAALPPPPLAPALPTYRLQDAGTAWMQDDRLWQIATTIGLSLAVAGVLARLRRPRLDRLARQILAIEHAARLPVLRCLDTYGRPVLAEMQPLQAMHPELSRAVALPR